MGRRKRFGEWFCISLLKRLEIRVLEGKVLKFWLLRDEGIYIRHPQTSESSFIDEICTEGQESGCEASGEFGRPLGVRSRREERTVVEFPPNLLKNKRWKGNFHTLRNMHASCCQHTSCCQPPFIVTLSHLHITYLLTPNPPNTTTQNLLIPNSPQQNPAS